MNDKYVWKPGDIEILDESKLKSLSALEQAKQLFDQELEQAVKAILDRWRKMVGRKTA